MKNNLYNKYDWGLIVLIASLVVGDLGGALQPVRVISLLFLPQVLSQCRKVNRLVALSCLFFVFWLAYMACSLTWTSDFSQGIKEIFYYISHFSLFILIQYWCKQALNPVRSIIGGWLTFFLLSCPVAFYELLFDKHFSTSQFSSDLMQNLGGGYIYQKKFAAINFLNYGEKRDIELHPEFETCRQRDVLSDGGSLCRGERDDASRSSRNGVPDYRSAADSLYFQSLLPEGEPFAHRLLHRHRGRESLENPSESE